MPYPTRRLKFVADFVSRGNSPTYAESSNTFVVNQACVQRHGLDLTNLKFNVDEDIRGFKGKLRSGDVLVNSTGTGTLGRSCLFEVEDDAPYFADGHVTIVRDSLKRFNPRFLSAFFTVHQELVTVEASEGATNQIELNREKVRSLRVPFPPMEVQNAIVQHIEAKDQEILRFIQRKLETIELFEEQKRTIISLAVTRGINPDASMKRSGLDWLPEIPAHWDIRRNIRLFRERIEKDRAALPVLIVSLHSGVTVGEDQDEDGRPRRLIEDRTAYKFAARGDIAYNMMRMWQGAVGVVPEDGLVSPAYVVARALDDVSSAYYVLLFRTEAYKNEINRNSTGIVSDRNRLYWDGFKELYSPVPPLEEQSRIVCALDAECAKIDGAIAKAKREIELIEEFRTTLISEVVTGKRDIHQLTAVKEPL